MIPADNYIVAQTANKVLLAPPGGRTLCILTGVEGRPSRPRNRGGRVTGKTNARETRDDSLVLVFSGAWTTKR
jgi:hypothetical protein